MGQVRNTLSMASRSIHHSISRATIRKVNTNNLAPEASHLDGFHSQTDTDVEIAQPWGTLGVPLDQEEEQQGKQQQSAGKDEQGDWNHDQPKGKAAELVMNRVGSQSHPVAFPLADRRVQPYGMKPGESAYYAMSGTGQMLFHNDKGSYVVVTNEPPEQSKDGKEVERFASLRHVQKKKQPREIKKGQQQSEAKHEGESVNYEIRCTKSRIEFRKGDEVVGYYDGSQWVFKGGEVLLGDDNKEKMKKVHRVTDADSEGDTAAIGSSKVWAIV